MIDMVGAKKVSSLTNADLDWEKVNMTETTYPRYHADATKSQKYVADTKHSMYLTTILLNDDFWNSLTVEDQGHMKTAGLYASRTERTKSVADAEEIKTSKNKQKELGIEEEQVVPFSSRTGEGREALLEALADLVTEAEAA